MNRVEKNTLFIGDKFKTVGLLIEENKPAKMGFGNETFNLKTITEAKAEELVKKGFRFLERIEKPKAEPKTEVEPKAEKPKK